MILFLYNFTESLNTKWSKNENILVNLGLCVTIWANETLYVNFAHSHTQILSMLLDQIRPSEDSVTSQRGKYTH